MVEMRQKCKDDNHETYRGNNYDYDKYITRIRTDVIVSLVVSNRMAVIGVRWGLS